MSEELPDLLAFSQAASDWLAANAIPLSEIPETTHDGQWASDDVAVFANATEQEMLARIEPARAWQRQKFEAGYGALTWPVKWGGKALPVAYKRAFDGEEAKYAVPAAGELLSVSMDYVAPTLARYGTDEQKGLIVPMLRAEQACCLLLSEPGAGSDLASLSTRAERDGDEWVIQGQKVWTSGARFATYGELLCRTGPQGSRDAGLTAFLLPLAVPGIGIRPIRQMTGGAYFNEVFLDDVRVSDRCRLGPVGEGWAVVMTTMAFDRGEAGGGGAELADHVQRLCGLARRLGTSADPVTRQRLANLYARVQAFRHMFARAVDISAAGPAVPGYGSLLKLMWAQELTHVSATASHLLGPRLIADTGEWGTYAWSQHVLGSPGIHLGGGTDEIQRNVIGERVLGLPREPRV